MRELFAERVILAEGQDLRNVRLSIQDGVLTRLDAGAVPEGAERVGLVLPALTDAHNHPSLFGELRSFNPVQLPSLGTMAEIADALRPQLRRDARIQVVLGWEAALTPGFTRTDLDAICESPWLMMDTSFHGAVANTAAMSLFQDFLASEGLELHGVMTPEGRLKEELAMLGFMVREAQTPVEELARGVEQYIEEAWSGGAATLYDMWCLTERQLEVLNALSPRHRASVPVHHISPLLMRRLIRKGRSVEGMHLKLFADGATGSQTALTTLPYTNTGQCGLAYHWGPDVEAAILEALDHGIRDLAIHAIGDRGVDHAIVLFGAWFGAARVRGLEVRARVEHLDFATPAQIARAAELGLRISPQPNFLFDLKAFDEILQPGLTAAMVPLRWMADSGATVMIGTDGMPNNMVFALHCAALAPFPCQRLTLPEVVRLSTVTVSEYEGRSRGRLAVGEPADLLILDAGFWDDAGSNHGLYDVDAVRALSLAEELSARFRGQVRELIRDGETLYQAP